MYRGTDKSLARPGRKQATATEDFDNLMFFWPCIMKWLYINYKLDALIIIYS